MTGVSGSLAASGVGILAIGTVLGVVSRLILQGRSHMTRSGSVLAGIVGAVVGGAATQAATGNPDQPRLWLVLGFSVVGTVAVLAVAERFVRRPAPTVRELIDAGESAAVEMKSTARHNLHTGQRDDRMEAVIAKTVAGFLNGRGGTLLIGVDDSGVVLGLDADLPYMKAPDLDRYELWLHDHLTRVLGAPAVARLTVSFPQVDGTAVCQVEVERSLRPVFVRPAKTDQVLFYARIGNSTRELSVAEAIEYAADHFARRSGWRSGGR
ncbi:MAG: ATP-binding protein [Cellulomonas sp.]|nr:ATP-binding protein [Cellulomonas sp.]